MYERPHGTIRQWCWDPPQINNAQDISLSAATAGTRQNVVSLQGQWNSARVVVALPVAWVNIVFELWGVIGSARFPVRSATARRSPFQATTSGIISAELFTISNFPVDEWIVRAVGDGTELNNAEVSLSAWGSQPGADIVSGPPQGLNNIAGATIAIGGDVFIAGQNRMTQIIAHNILPAGVPANTRFLMLFDTVTTPIPALAVPPVTPTRLLGDQQMSLTIPASGNCNIVGLVVAPSLTDRTFTAPPGAAEVLATVWFTQP